MLNILLAADKFQIKSAIMVTIIILVVLSAIFVSFAIMMQPSNSNGISAINGQQSDTFYGKNKSKSLASKLKKITVFCLIFMAVLMIAYFLIERLWTF